jgi:hypothetical protein
VARRSITETNGADGAHSSRDVDGGQRRGGTNHVQPGAAVTVTVLLIGYMWGNRLSFDESGEWKLALLVVAVLAAVALGLTVWALDGPFRLTLVGVTIVMLGIYAMDGRTAYAAAQPPQFIAFQYAPEGRPAGIYVVDPSIANQDCAAIPRLSHVSSSAGQPAWSPDRRSLVYTQLLGENWHLTETALLWERDDRGRRTARDDRTRLLTDDAEYHDVNPNWSPNGRFIAFVRIPATREDARPTTAGEIWVYDVESEQTRNVVTGRNVYPRWTPDGRSLVFTRQIDGSWIAMTVTIEDDGSTSSDIDPFLVAGQALTDAAALSLGVGGALAYTAASSEGPSNDIFFTKNHRTTETVHLASHGHDSQPVLAPESSRVAFISDRQAGSERWKEQLWVADISVEDGRLLGHRLLTAITSCQGSVQAPNW